MQSTQQYYPICSKLQGFINLTTLTLNLLSSLNTLPQKHRNRYVFKAIHSRVHIYRVKYIQFQVGISLSAGNYHRIVISLKQVSVLFVFNIFRPSLVVNESLETICVLIIKTPRSRRRSQRRVGLRKIN